MLKKSPKSKKYSKKSVKKSKKSSKKTIKPKVIDKSDIVKEYLISLQKQLKEKNLLSFFTFPEDSKIKKINDIDFTKMKKILKRNKKYHGKVLCVFTMVFHDKNSYKVFTDSNIYIGFSISFYPIHEDGTIKKTISGQKNSWGCDMHISLEDLKVTKFSFKLIDYMIKIMYDEEISCPALTGHPLRYIIQKLQKKGYNFDGLLNPLAGL
ncbi:MAG: hypothetical protein ACRCZI_04675 [Cetobacterium sp.]